MASKKPISDKLSFSESKQILDAFQTKYNSKEKR